MDPGPTGGLALDSPGHGYRWLSLLNQLCLRRRAQMLADLDSETLPPFLLFVFIRPRGLPPTTRETLAIIGGFFSLFGPGVRDTTFSFLLSLIPFFPSSRQLHLIWLKRASAGSPFSAVTTRSMLLFLFLSLVCPSSGGDTPNC